MTFHQFPDAGDAAFDVVHTMPAAGSPAAGEVPPAPPVAPLVASHEPGRVTPPPHSPSDDPLISQPPGANTGHRKSPVNVCDQCDGSGIEADSVNGQWLTEGGTLAELEQWEPTGCVDDDLAFLASVAFLAQTCKAVLSAHSGTVAEMLKADRPEKHATVPGGTVERVWKSRSWKWDRTSDVLAVILEETEEIPPQTRAALEEGLPERVSWRIGNAEKDEPGLSRLGIDVAELRHREPGGRWELRFTWGDPS